MQKILILAGASAVAMFAQYLAYSPTTDAGWGPPFACGAGPKTGDVSWDSSIKDPAEKKAVLTGVTSKADKKADDYEQWTVAELTAGKPLFLYKFVDGVTDPTDDNYKLSRKLELSAFNKQEVIDQLNKEWRAKKVGLDMEADMKKAENQARVEFWSFTKVKMGVITTAKAKQLKPRTLLAALKKYKKKSDGLAKTEITRLEKAAKAEAKRKAALEKSESPEK